MLHFSTTFKNKLYFWRKSTRTQITVKERFDNSKLLVLLKYCHLTQPSQRGNRTHRHYRRFWREEQPVVEKRQWGPNFDSLEKREEKLSFGMVIIIIITVIFFLSGWVGRGIIVYICGKMTSKRVGIYF